MDAKLKWLSGCFTGCSFPAPPQNSAVFFFLPSAAVTSLEDITVSRHQKSPLLHRLSLVLGGIGLLFHFMCVPEIM